MNTIINSAVVAVVIVCSSRCFLHALPVEPEVSPRLTASNKQVAQSSANIKVLPSKNDELSEAQKVSFDQDVSSQSTDKNVPLRTPDTVNDTTQQEVVSKVVVSKKPTTKVSEVKHLPRKQLVIEGGEVALDDALYLVQQANKMQSEGKNVTLGIVEEKIINGEQVEVFHDRLKEVVRDDSMDYKLSLLCLAIVGIILFLVYTYCLY